MVSLSEDGLHQSSQITDGEDVAGKPVAVTGGRFDFEVGHVVYTHEPVVTNVTIRL